MKPEDLAPYDAFRVAVLGRLDAELGERTWSTPLGDQIDWAGSVHEGGASAAVMPLYEFEGRYERDAWSRAAEIVTAVGLENGFADVRVLSANPEEVVLFGQDPNGGSYRFEIGVNTVFRVYVDRSPQPPVTPVSS